MADRMSVEVKGGPQLAAGNLTLSGNIKEAAGDAFETVGERVAAAASSRVPRRTGRLAGSIDAAAGGGGEAIVGMGGGVPYAGWIEYGGTRGRPYVSSGRYFMPVALDAAPLLTVAGTRAATVEIGRMRWPKPMF